MKVRGSEARLRALEKRVTVIEDVLRKREALLERFVDGYPLRAARLAAGWTLQEVATGLGMTRNIVCMWELRKQRLPRWRAEQLVALFIESGATPPKFPELEKP